MPYRRFWYILFLLIWTVIIYSRTFHNGFLLWDDNTGIIENKTVQSLSPENIRSVFSSFVIGMYQPFTTLIWGATYRIHGYDPLMFHSVSLIFHLISTLLVFFLCLKLLKSTSIAFLVALMHAVHPMHTESVAWASETRDVVYACFFLLSLIFYVKYIEKPITGSLIMSFIFFIISALSKSAAVTLPLLLVLIDYYYKRKITVMNSLEKIPFFIVAVSCGVLSMYSQKYAIPEVELPAYSLTDRLFIAGYSVVYYLFHYFIPVNLSAFHPFPLKTGSHLPTIFYLSLIFNISLIILVFRSGKYKKHAIFGFLFFIISVSPVLQLIPFGKAMLAERYTYIPYIGLSFVPAMIIDSISRNNRMLFNKIRAISLIIITGFILIFSVQTFHRTGVWKNTEKLFYDVTKKYPDDATGFRVLGLACSQDGNFRSALVAYSKAIEISPSLPGTWYNRGLVKAELKDYYGAASDYSKCISLDPKNFRSYNNRANIKVKLKDYNGAMSDYNAAIIISPSFAEAFNNRGNLKALTGDLKNAFSDFEKAIELDPAYAQAYSNRGNVKAYFNDFEGAVQDYRKALGINPDDKKTIHNLEITQKKLETMPEN